ncbi:C-reactive protein-like [Eleutherodactylus coqui]|uniref:C-reactive protein-like n=1 Tax=Eleutherodactylus coqui TaxID=57060 RepID=UPI003462A9E8
MLIWAILCTIISRSFCQTDLGDDVFTFPNTSELTYALIHTERRVTFTEMSLCMRFKTEKDENFTLFSLSTSRYDNAFEVEGREKNLFSLSIYGDQCKILKKPFTRDWTSLCLSWTSDTGDVKLWIHGDYYGRSHFQKGKNFPGVTFMYIGKKLDSFSGGFDKSQSFIGDIADINLWEKALTEEEVMEFIYHDNIRGNVITWRNLRFSIQRKVTRNTAPCLPIG